MDFLKDGHLTPKIVRKFLSDQCSEIEQALIHLHRLNCHECDKQYKMVFWMWVLSGEWEAKPDPDDLPIRNLLRAIFDQNKD